jgi:gliding motility-associated-like protein
MYNDAALSVIENPDTYGPGCSFNYRKIVFNTVEQQPLQYGLPSFIAGDLNKTESPFDFSSTSNCLSFNVSFLMNKITGADSVRWDFGDGIQSTSFNPVHQYSAAGTYVVSLKVFKPNCAAPFELITHNVTIGAAAGNNFLPADTSVCNFKNFQVSSSLAGQSYLWNTGEISRTIDVTAPGTYWLDVFNNGCSGRDSFTVKQLLPVTVSLGGDTTVCSDKPVLLDAGTAANYLWNNGSSARTLLITKPGLYSVTVKSIDGCSAVDSINIVSGECSLYIPSAFSPNGDGINDGFSISGGIFTPSFTMKIFNRYGEIVYQTNDQSSKWDGTYKGVPVPMGMYLWFISYKKNDNDIPLKGTVLLLR